MKKLIFCILAIILLTGCEQASKEEHGAIYGSVLLANQLNHSGTIVIATNSGTSYQGITETSGVYAITGLPVGTYQVTVTRNAWYTTSPAGGQQVVVITGGDSVLNVDFTMDSDSLPPDPPG